MPLQTPTKPRHFIAYLVCLLLSFKAGGQEVFLRHFTVDHGLPSNETYQIEADQSGRLLIATDRGLARYDGYSFETLQLQSPAALMPVYSIYPAPSGNTYFAGLKGQLYVYRNEVLRAYPYNHAIALPDSNAGLLIADAVAEDQSGLLIRYNTQTGSVIHASADGRIERREEKRGIYFNLSNRFCYASPAGEQLENTTQPVFITWQDGSRSDDTVRLSWPHGYLRKPMHAQVGNTDVFCAGRQLLFYQNKKRVGDYRLPRDPLCMTPTPSGELLIGFERGGAATYRVARGTCSGPYQAYLANLSVSGIHVDFQGGYWFATLDDGVYYAYPSAALFWNDNSRVAFMVAHGDTAFAAQLDGDIHRLHAGRMAGRLQVPLANGEQLLSCAFSPTGSLLAITSKGFYQQSRSVSWQFMPGHDKLLLHTNDTLAYGAGIERAVLHRYRFPSAGLLGTVALPKRIISMAQDSSQGLWLGTMEGLYHFSEPRGLQYAGAQCTALQDRIVSLTMLPGGWLAVATLSSGLMLYRNGVSHVIHTANGLATPVINNMQAADGALWLGTNKGITELWMEHGVLHTRHYGSDAGLPTLDIHAFAVGGGWLYLKWINGMVAIDLTRLRRGAPSRSVRIHSVMAGNQSVGHGSPLAHDQNNVVFGFSSVNFAAGPHQVYRYKLAGFEDHWHYTRDRKATYTNLPPGSYSMLVQVEDEAGRYSTGAANWPLHIRPAFWQRGWFVLLSMLAALSLVWWLFRLRLNAVRRRNQLLLDLAESRQKALVQLISPHFLFNILNTAQAYILSEDRLKAASFIARIARLLRLSLETSKDRYVPMDKETELLRKYTELEETRTPGKFSCRIRLSPDINPLSVRIPGMLIQPFVENAIKHGMMHLRDRPGMIDIIFELKQGMLLCRVEDNGIGRVQAAIINEKNYASHQSVGIDITRKRLELLHREQQSQYLFEMKDRLNAQGKPEGTTVIFSIPYLTQS